MVPLSPPETRRKPDQAIATAAKLPGKQGSDILFFTRNAFVQEYHTVAPLSAVVLAIMAGVIVVKLKGLKAMAEEHQEEGLH